MTNRNDPEGSRTGTISRWSLGIITISALAAHLLVSWDIARQPLDINRGPGAPHSIIWSLHNDTIHRQGPGGDFFAVYHAGVAFEQDRNPYRRDESPRVTPYYYSFRYLPVVGQTLGSLMKRLDPKTAYVTWLCIVEAILGLTILAFWKAVRRPWVRYFATWGLLLSSPYFLELHMGQFTFVTVGLLAMCIMLYGSGAARTTPSGLQFVAGLCYVASTLLKVFPLLAGVAFLKRKRLWGLPAAALLAILLTSIVHFFSHPEHWHVFYSSNFVKPFEAGEGMDAGNFGLPYAIRELSTALRVPGILRNWSLLMTGWRVFLLGVTSLLVLASRTDRLGTAVSALILAHFLSYLHVWEHHMSGIVLLGFLVLRETTDRSGASRMKFLVPLLCMSIVMLCLPTPSALLDTAMNPEIVDPSRNWAPHKRYLLAFSKALPTLVLYFACVKLLIADGVGLPWRNRRPNS